MAVVSELATRLVAALDDVPGLRPAMPVTNRVTTSLRWNLDGLAVDITPTLVEVRVIALALPLRPVLAHAEAVLRTVLTGTEYEHACLRLVVTDLDACAVSSRTP
jgi:hypothetical protein